MRFNAETNPDGVRCTIQDGNVNIFGRDPKTGYARRPLDNTGVQYGLKALRDGTISADEFLDVNRNIGGFSINGEYIPERMRMDPELAKTAYRSEERRVGKSVSVRVDLGGRRIIKKHTQQEQKRNQKTKMKRLK